MNWFRNLKTLTKLMAGFGLVTLAMAGLGYSSLRSMATLDALLETTYDRDLVGISAAKEVTQAMLAIGRASANALALDGKGNDARQVEVVDEHFRELDAELPKVEASLATTEERKHFSHVRELLPAYRGAIQEVMRLDAEGRAAEARAALLRALATADQIEAAIHGISASKDASGHQSHDQGRQMYESARRLQWILLIGAVLASLAAGLWIAAMIASPLRTMVSVAAKLAEGDLNQSLDYRSRDEAGQLADAFRAMIAGFSAPVRESAAVLEKVASGDLTQRMTGEARGTFALIKESLNGALDRLELALAEVKGSAEQVSATAQQLSGASEELSSGAQEQASSIEETSATLEEITAAVRQNADNARQANQLALGSRSVAEEGGSVVGGAVAAMNEINASSKRIAEIITAIDEIAFQTNLLALNAAVEAARAGEQGRGFAVVASEVRSLAQRSATAAKEIKALIQDSVRKVENGSGLVNQSGKTLGEIVTSVKRVTDIVGEITAASDQQAAGVEQVARAMSQMDQVTQANSAQTEELSSSAEQLAATAQHLREMVDRFTVRHATAAPARREPRSAPQPTARRKAQLRGPSAGHAGLAALARSADAERNRDFVEF